MSDGSNHLGRRLHQSAIGMMYLSEELTAIEKSLRRGGPHADLVAEGDEHDDPIRCARRLERMAGVLAGVTVRFRRTLARRRFQVKG